VAALSLGQRVKRVSIMADEDAGILGRCEDWGRRALLANLQGDVSDVQEEHVLGERPDRPPHERSQAWLQHQVETEIQVMLAGELGLK
jgi:hypothetical protein